MFPDEFAPLDVSRYELCLRATRQIDLPDYLGSTLRGAFGQALKRAVCVINHRDCLRCIVAERCPYPYLFETPVPPAVPELRGQQRAPHPFILSPPLIASSFKRVWKLPRQLQQPAGAWGQPAPGTVSPAVLISSDRRILASGDNLTFGLLLIGRAIEYLPYVIFAVSEMARHGLGAERARFDLKEVRIIDETGTKTVIYTGQARCLALSRPAISSLSDLIRRRLGEIINKDRLKIRFITPTRIRVDSDLQVSLSFELFARNLLRRISMLALLHGRARLDLDYRGLIRRAVEVETVTSSLRWDDLERFSNRQKVKMKLGGFTGEVEYAGSAIEEFLPLIAAGEILHVGAGTSFGLGRYEIVAEDQD